jgi:hypothetical protein
MAEGRKRGRIPKEEKKLRLAERALTDLRSWMSGL